MVEDVLRPYVGPTEVIGRQYHMLQLQMEVELKTWVLIGPDGEPWLGDDPVAMAEAAAAAARSRHPFDGLPQSTETQ